MSIHTGQFLVRKNSLGLEPSSNPDLTCRDFDQEDLSFHRVQLLTLPVEILFKICLCLDYQGLLAIAQTCRVFYDITNNRYFLETLCSSLESTPGFQRPFFESDNKNSLSDLRRYAFNTLRIHGTWLGPSDLQFHCRAVTSPLQWESVEVLPGCKWLFGVDRDEHAVMVDLDSSIHYELFKTTNPDDPQSLYRFQLSFKEGNRFSFWVALFGWDSSWDRRTRISIYEVNYLADCYFPFEPIHLMTIWDTDNTGIRFQNSVNISDRYIIQCYTWRSEHDWDEILQLRRLSDDPSVSQKCMEQSVAEKGEASDSWRPKQGSRCKAYLLPHNRLAVIIGFAIQIYAINDSDDEALPKLLSLHRVTSNIHTHCISRPLVGHDATYFVGTCGLQARRVYISHDSAIPPTTDILGPLRSACMWDTRHIQFGALVSCSYGSKGDLEMGTYDLTSYPPGYQWRYGDCVPKLTCIPLISFLVGLDENSGRLILYYRGAEHPFLVMELLS